MKPAYRYLHDELGLGPGLGDGHNDASKIRACIMAYRELIIAVYLYQGKVTHARGSTTLLIVVRRLCMYALPARGGDKFAEPEPGLMMMMTRLQPFYGINTCSYHTLSLLRPISI